jgi:hypothetical protein
MELLSDGNCGLTVSNWADPLLVMAAIRMKRKNFRMFLIWSRSFVFHRFQDDPANQSTVFVMPVN